MTVQTEFTSWQFNPKFPDPKTCSPCCLTWRDYLLQRWGGSNLGCYNKRPIREGTALSSHGSGAAIDWRYENPGPGRTTFTSVILPFILGNSLELGVQSIHDYAGDRIWRPPGTSGRPSGPVGNGWKKQNGAGGGMGEAWATYVHLEVHPSRWDDTRTVEEMLQGAVTPEPPQPQPQPPSSSGVFAVQGYRKEVREGTQGKMAKMCQQQINLIASQGIKEDGDFGSQSVAALKNVQTVLGCGADGVCGPKTWQAFEDGIKTQAESGNWG